MSILVTVQHNCDGDKYPQGHFGQQLEDLFPLPKNLFMVISRETLPWTIRWLKASLLKREVNNKEVRFSDLEDSVFLVLVFVLVNVLTKHRVFTTSDQSLKVEAAAITRSGRSSLTIRRPNFTDTHIVHFIIVARFTNTI